MSTDPDEPMSVPTETSFDALVERAEALARQGRRLLGLTGAPGAGKSTVAERLIEAIGAQAVLVPMDGYHLAQEELERLGRADRKGAPDTFDAAGYVALLQRLRRGDDGCVYAPRFSRDIEEPIAGAIPVPADIPLVVTEGNYLLVEDGAWSGVAPLLDDVWYCEVDEEVRLQRLTERHEAFGKSPEEAYEWARGSDQRNAEVVEATRASADLIVRV